MTQILPKILFDLFDSNGLPLSNGKIFFYESGTTIDAPVYMDQNLSSPHAQPVVADSAGRFPVIFLDDGAYTYRLQVKDAANALIADFDPINSAGTVGTGQLQAGAVTEPKLGDGAVSHRVLGLGAVANENTADMAEMRLKGRRSGAGTGPTQDLTPEEAAAILAAFTADDGTHSGSAGVVPAPGIGFLASLKVLGVGGWRDMANITGNASAYEINLGNLKIKGGIKTSTTASDSITFANVFPTACLFAIAWPDGGGASTQSTSNSIRVVAGTGTRTISGFSVYCSSEDEIGDVFLGVGTTNAASSVTYQWLALGH